ncbi:DUF885 family protein [Sphingomonas ginkgonis]|uniref:DUF885 family protein n=1 Tax=Sphingomonas ginkgonis TaxID=2315330 RepID=A0A429VBZ2_9SPHN|nr:DUF885 family protein [Sphingomonas ginkgonis]RST31411.1 DUF885 family protein [Sphingomonas ginkgonis]
MDRRHFLASAGAATAFVGLEAAAAPVRRAARLAGAGQRDAALNALFDRIFNEQVRDHPTYASFLGLDKGPNAALKFKLDTRPATVSRAADLAANRRHLAELNAFDPARLSPMARLNREIVIYDLETNMFGPTHFDFDDAQRPYVLSQQDGAYFSIPDFLNTGHTIDNARDAEAYLARLSQFPAVLDAEAAEQRRQAARGYVAPGWSLDLVLKQMQALRSPAPEQNTMTVSLVTRTRAKNIPGNWQARAAAIVRGQVYPALDRQIAMVRELRGRTPAGDGVWRVPHGDAVYAAALREATTTDYTPDQVHQLGLDQVREIEGQLDPLLRAAGMTQGSVGQRLTALNKSPEQLYPDTDEGRRQLIDSLNAGVRDMEARLPRAFATLPKQPLEIRRVPVEIQEGAPNGYYNPASLDGTRPAIYFINLKSTTDWPKYSLPALTFHEGVPGHHLQGSIAQQSGDLPMLRRNQFYSAYGEGWALYAEQLADELGAYKGIERAGYLQSYLFRAARLVVDTGLNHKRWSREQATDYMVQTTGFARPRTQREVERYCASPGQACSYKIGHLAWNRLRRESQQALGSKFDLRQFHEVLKDGAMPLTILERRVRERTQAQLRSA